MSNLFISLKKKSHTNSKYFSPENVGVFFFSMSEENYRVANLLCLVPANRALSLPLPALRLLDKFHDSFHHPLCWPEITTSQRHTPDISFFAQTMWWVLSGKTAENRETTYIEKKKCKCFTIFSSGTEIARNPAIIAFKMTLWNSAVTYYY